jgi:hypothetical protein
MNREDQTARAVLARIKAILFDEHGPKELNSCADAIQDITGELDRYDDTQPDAVYLLMEQESGDSDEAGVVMSAHATKRGAERARLARRKEMRDETRTLGRHVVFYREGTEHNWTHDHAIEEIGVQP